jgi:FHA domain/Double zinc ribbon
MIVCPNCNHQNPDAAVQCEACYTPLPAMTTCPNCGASVQADASFCGQCGFNLQGAETPLAPAAVDPLSATVSPNFEVPDLTPPDPLVQPDPLVTPPSNLSQPESPSEEAILAEVVAAPAAAAVSAQPSLAAGAGGSKTQLQTQVAQLLHVQTNTSVELPVNLAVIHIGKPNDRIPPDIDVSGFPHSEIVSRIHADIRVEGDIYYIEDVGSSNGTYINNAPLPSGNRHRLRPGDRIALGKGDKVTFLFQIS